MTAPPRFAAESITVQVGGRAILREAYVDAVAGTVTALVGRSGAGKTTLFETLVGRRTPERGEVRWDGARLARPSLAGLARRGLCYLPERSWLPPGFRVAAVLDLAARRSGAVWTEIVTELGVAAWTDRPTGALSTGELRLTELAFALTCKPRGILLDEPFRGLEPRYRETVGVVLRRLAKQGVAVLYADHDARLVAETADRLYGMEEGRTRAVSDFRERPLEEWYHEWPR